MTAIVKASNWAFVTSSTGSIGIEFFAAEGGKIYLQAPDGKQVDFSFGAAGGGLSFGFRLPKIGKIHIPVKGKSINGNVGLASFPNTGKLYILETFDREELSASDIRGACIFAEVSGGLIAGGSATGMIFGMNPAWLAAGVIGGGLGMIPSMLTKCLGSATGILLVAGINVGIQGGGGLVGCVGGLW